MSNPSTVQLAPAAAIILAAGRSTRMRSLLPKPLHPVCGLPMTSHVIRACRAAGVERVVVVIGHEAQQVRGGLDEDVEYALQHEPRGTADAVRAAMPLLANWSGTVLTLAGDTPLIRPETLRGLMHLRQQSSAAMTMLTMHLEAPTGYGRIVRETTGELLAIVEEKDATPEQRTLTECNPSVYAFEASVLRSALELIDCNNAQKEYYLTDTVGILREQGAQVETMLVQDAREVLGVNTRVELAQATNLMRLRLLEKWMLAGVTIIDPASTYVDVDVEIGQDSIVEPGTFLLNGTRTGYGCILGPHSRIERSTLGDGVEVAASWVSDSVLEEGVRVGPFARMRLGSRISTGARVGNFVEIKNTTLGQGTQAMHLSYLGDSEVGARTNIGAGVITCNYDGFSKHRTVVGEDVFVGSHSTLIAPVALGNGAFVAAGSPVTEDVPENALAIARERVVIKPDWAAQYRARKKQPQTAETRS